MTALSEPAKPPISVAADPVRVAAQRILVTRDYVWFTAITLLIIGGSAWFAASWISRGDWQSRPALFTVVTVLLLAVWANYQFRWWLLLAMRRPVPRPVRPGWTVGVATTFVPGLESLEMLEETVRALVAVDYPHDTWVLDEGNDERVKRLCERLGAHHFTRMSNPRLTPASGPFQRRTKFGNYNAWFHEVAFDRYDVVSTFDPDHVPEPSFLSRVLGYFDDPGIGYVQAAQAYYNQRASFIARGAAEEVYAYYSSVQASLYAFNHAVVVGCHNTHRVAALKQIGGFAAHDADDIMTTLVYRAHGWQGVYVPEILARGLTPVDWSGYLTQQRRWTRSVLDVKLRVLPRLARGLPLRTRAMSVAHGLNYVQRSLVVGVSVGVLAAMLSTGHVLSVLTSPDLKALTIFVTPLLLGGVYRQRFYLDPSNERGVHWRATLLQFAKWPHTLMALCEVVVGRQLEYATTPKVRKRARSFALVGPQVAIAVSIGICWAIGMLTWGIPHRWLHGYAALVVAIAIGFVASDFRTFPPPYQAGLRRAR